MQIPNELYDLLQSLCKSLNDILKYPYISPTDKKLERFLYVLEKWRFAIYEQVKFLNDTYPVNEIHFINDEYKASLKDNILSLYIPEKLPNLKNRSSYAHKQIILNIAEITKPYERLFYDKFVIVVVKIFERRKVWDMVQGFYSDTPHIEVSVLEADKIISFINNNLPNINK